VTLVTAIFGGRDTPVVLPASLDADDRVMFTDGEGRPGWRVVRTLGGSDPRRAAREIKTRVLDHVDGDVVVWVDGRIALTAVPLRPLLRHALREADVAGYPHPWRRCLYDEARECAKLQLAPSERVDAQVAEYRAAGMPAGAGLWNTMVLARRRSAATLELGRAWWAEIEKHTLRDQISFPFVLWRDGLACSKLGPDVYAPRSSKNFKRGRHAK
jgi:hypothetical protein